jgi:ABC-type Fe3+/spermidine/putrescine transport system ATPase subunit
MNVIEANGLGKRYGRTWALRGCTLAIPAGHVVALVGPNGAGKTTLMSLAVGLNRPTAGVVTVLGGEPAGSPTALGQIAFVAQDAPLYRNLSVADMLHVARNLNQRWDASRARVRLSELDIPLTKRVGQNLTFAFNISYYQNYAASKIHDIGDPPVISALLLTVPALLGVFAGAPLLARELATGSFRFAWTQGCGRLRWTLAQLALPAITLTAALGAFSVLFSWYLRPFIADGQVSVLMPIQFTLHGVAYAGWTLAAFAIGAFAGVMIWRVVPALAAALAAWAALALATAIFFRPYDYETPLRTSGGAPHMSPARLSSSWVLSSWTTGPGGRLVSPATANNLIPLSALHSPNPNAPADWMIRHGFTQWWSYQPPSRFGHFQLIEGGWLVALSVVLIAATVWLIQRRSV